MTHISIFITILFLLPTPAQSAGFDCALAGTKIEKLICQDMELSALDSRMSEAYEQALTPTNDTSQMKEQQHRWLRDVRNRCSDFYCLKSAYTRRIEQLSTKSTWMTNEKEQAICKAVVDAINDGSMAKRIKSFEPANEDDRRAWEDRRPSFSSLSLNQTLKISAHGRTATLGLVQGGGTCGNCDIEDINAIESAVYPFDESDDYYRWMSWGQCDHFLFIEEEPVIVTGGFGQGTSRATFVSWLAPDGAKRALCYLGQDSGKKTTRKITTNNNPELCDAVGKNRIDGIPWATSLSIPRENTGNDATMWDSSKNATLDVNLDGKKETIVLFDRASGAGCGSYRQWLREFTPEQRSIFQADPHSTAESPLNGIFASNGYGPVKNAKESDEWYAVKLFRYGGKPYILGQGTESSAEIISVWGNQKKTWCEYQVLPQHRIEAFYPVETWTALTVSKFKKIKGGQALHNAASGNNIEKALLLIRSRTPVDAADDSGQTPLAVAVLMEHVSMIKLLLDNGASVDGVLGWQMTPLMTAVLRNNEELVGLLLGRKANPNIRTNPHPDSYNDKGSTALGIARKAEGSYSHTLESADAKKNKRIIEILSKAGATE